MSASVLRAFTGGRETVMITGHPWQREKEQTVGIGNLGAKVLCTRHNALFSRLDDFMGRTFTTLRTETRSLRDGADGARVRAQLVNGHDIERWMLKALCGLLRVRPCKGVGGNLWRPPDSWLQIVKGEKSWPPGWGLYVDHDPGVAWTTMVTLPMISEPPRPLPIGLTIWFHGLVLRLLVVDPQRATLVGSGPRYHRLREIRWWSEAEAWSLLLGWKQESRNPTARLNVPITLHRA